MAVNFSSKSKRIKKIKKPPNIPSNLRESSYETTVERLPHDSSVPGLSLVVESSGAIPDYTS